ncbi:MAG: SulP family inorganic anion transporter [Candidatus Zixiibacteriota bacterium]
MAILRRIFPFIAWFDGYTKRHFRFDLTAGLTVSLILAPQSMAYAQLAGLPAYHGLYASIIPPLMAALFGSCRQLSTGPVAIVALLTSIALEPLAVTGSASYIAYSILLAFIVGLFQFLLGILRLGLVVNFLSHPVVNGFTNGAALIIATSQLPTLFGITVEKADHHYETLINTYHAAGQFIHWPTLLLGLLAFIIMFTLRRIFPKVPNVLVAVAITTIIAWAIDFEKNYTGEIGTITSPVIREKIVDYNQALTILKAKSHERATAIHEHDKAASSQYSETIDEIVHQSKIDVLSVEIESLKARAALLRSELRGFLLTAVSDSKKHLRFEPNRAAASADRTWRLKIGMHPIDTTAVQFIGGGAVVGHIPSGLPALSLPDFDPKIITSLIPISAIIALLGFIESISVARAIASRAGYRLDANQELIGQGLANMSASLTQGFPLSGSFVRSAINFQLGAYSGLSNVISSVAVLIILLFLTPLFYYLPLSVLAATIINAVIHLFNFQGFIHAWRAQWYDGLIGVVTFFGTLYFAPHLDQGIMLGIGLSVGWYLLRSMKPAVTLLAKHPDRTYRSQDRFGLNQCRHIALIRYDGALFFANINQLEEIIFDHIRTMPELKHIIIMANGINELDASGEETLSNLVTRVREAGIDISLTGLNNAVIGAMKRTGLYEKIGRDHLFRTVNLALGHIWDKAHHESDEKLCPLAMHPFRKYPVASTVKKDPRFLDGPTGK